jgi:hypothetical protein
LFTTAWFLSLPYSDKPIKSHWIFVVYSAGWFLGLWTFVGLEPDQETVLLN